MLHDFRSELKLFLLVAAVSAVLAVAGILLVKNVSNQVTHTPPPASAPQPQAIEGWQTYRNDEFGFELKYPSDWIDITLTDVVGGSSFEFSNAERSAVVQITMGGDLDLFYILWDAELGETIEKNLIYYIKIGNEFVSDHPAVRSTADYRNFPAGLFPRGEEVLVSKDGGVVSFAIWGSSSQIVQENQVIFNQILATFRFVEE